MSIAAFDLFTAGDHQPPPDCAPSCSIKACAFPQKERGLCWQHLHFFDFDISMTGEYLDSGDMYDDEDPWRPVLYVATSGELDNLDKSIKVIRQGETEWLDAHHGDSLFTRKGWTAVSEGGWAVTQADGAKSTISDPRWIGLNNGRFKMRRGGGSHSSSKTTRGRARAASRDGKGSRHSTKEKRWTREAIEVLEARGGSNLVDEILSEQSIEPEGVTSL